MSKKDYLQNITGTERRFLTHPVQIEKRNENDSEEQRIEGVAAKYNSVTTIGNWFKEEVLPGAFDDVLNDDVRCLFNHDPNHILARSVNGEGTLELFVDQNGLNYRYQTPNRTFAKDLEDAIRTGDVSQSSFGFSVSEENWIEVEGELPLRQIVKVKRLYDVSPVTYPAYPDATVGKRSLTEFQTKEIKVNDPEVVDQRAKTLDVYEAQYLINKNSI